MPLARYRIKVKPGAVLDSMTDDHYLLDGNEYVKRIEMTHHHELTDMGKLAHLLEHWQGHNLDHAENYRSWAEKAEASGRQEAAEILRQAAEATDRMNELFAQALEKLK